MRVLFLVFCLGLAGEAYADQCLGGVVQGRCYGTILPDYTNPGARRDDFFHNSGRGYHVSPKIGPAFEGHRLHNYSKPVIVLPNGGIMWADPEE